MRGISLSDYDLRNLEYFFGALQLMKEFDFNEDKLRSYLRNTPRPPNSVYFRMFDRKPHNPITEIFSNIFSLLSEEEVQKFGDDHCIGNQLTIYIVKLGYLLYYKITYWWMGGRIRYKIIDMCSKKSVDYRFDPLCRTLRIV